MTIVTYAALQQAPAAGGGGSLTPFLIQMAAIAAIFYFIIIRPQQKQRKQHETRLLGLKRGDQIVTAGGIVGEVSHIKAADGNAKLDDHVTIRSGESKLVVERGRIARVITPAAPAATTATTAS